MIFYHDEFSTFVDNHSDLALENVKKFFGHQSPHREPPDVKIEVPRWTSVDFPKKLAKEVGALGWSVPTADLLRRVAVDHHYPEVAAYHESVADSLGEPGPEPVIVDMEPQYHAAFLAMSELHEAVQRRPGVLSSQAEAWLQIMLREATRQVEHGTYNSFLYVGLPVDPVMPNILPHDTVSTLAVSVGAEMTAVARDIEVSDPERAAQLKGIVDRWYPEEHAEIEVSTAKEHFWLTAFGTVDIDDYNPEFLKPISGSVHLDHYGPGSEYSATDTAHSYRIYGVYQDLEPGEPIQSCLLVSDTHALVAEVYWNDDLDLDVAG